MIHHLIARRAANYPEKIAIEYNQEAISYQELLRRAADISRELSQHTLAQEELIGIHLPASIDFVVAMLGVLQAKAAFVPIDIATPRSRVEPLLKLARLRYLIGATPTKIQTLDGAALPSAQRTSPLAYVIFTSGSTGEPKGAMIEHSGLMALIEAERVAFNFQPEDRVLQFASVGFDVSVYEILTTLAAGATLCIPTSEERRVGPPLIQFLREERISIATLLPTVLASIPNQALPNLRTIVTGGEPCPQRIVDDWARERSFFNAYGPTEATIGATYSVCAPGKQVTIGKAFSHVSLYLLDEEMRPVAPYERGEIYLGGICVGRGYLFDASLTQQKFIPNPFDTGRLYKTGDFARRLPDGELMFLGRIDEQVKHRGVRVELGEIEQALLQCDTVTGGAVLVEKDQLVAFYLGMADAPKISEMLRQRLPVSLVPSRVIRLSSAPLTINGKWDKAALRASLQAPSESTDVAEPQTDEDKIVALFSVILSRPIQADDNFFLCGGDSLLAAKLLFRLEEAFPSADVDRAFYQSPTPAGITASLRSVLLREEYLADLEFPAPLLPDIATRGHVILTGATGYLGIFLLKELQEREENIICLLRGDSIASAWARLKNNAERYGVEIHHKKITIAMFDLTSPRGVPEELFYPATLYHCAAKVDLLRPYSMLRAENVSGVASLLALCSKRTRFHLVSSYSAIDKIGGYGQSKHVAERLVERSSMEAVITRPTFIVGRAGHINQGDLLYALLRESLRQRRFPELRVSLDVVSVEWLADKILSLLPGEYTMCSSRALSCGEVVSLMQQRGITIELCPFETWRGEARGAIEAHLTYLTMLAASSTAMWATRSAPESREVLGAYLDGVIALGLGA